MRMLHAHRAAKLSSGVADKKKRKTAVSMWEGTVFEIALRTSLLEMGDISLRSV